MARTRLWNWLTAENRWQIARGLRPTPRTRRLGFRPRLERLEDRVTPDSTGPRVLNFTPTQVINATFDHLDLNFNEAIDPASLDFSDVSILGPTGPVTPKVRCRCASCSAR